MVRVAFPLMVKPDKEVIISEQVGVWLEKEKMKLAFPSVVGEGRFSPPEVVRQAEAAASCTTMLSLSPKTTVSVFVAPAIPLGTIPVCRVERATLALAGTL